MDGAEPMTLYHWTCADHGRPGIEREGVIRPGSDLGVNLPQSMFAWFTDLDAPNRDALGLTNAVAKCDRLAHGYIVDSPKVMPWMSIRRALPRHFVDMLETTPGAMPRHWFVAAEPIPTVGVVR